MPLTPTNPENEQVPSTVAKDIDTLHVTGLNIMINPNDATATTVDVQWSEGYMDGDTFVLVRRKQAMLSGPDVISKINETTDGVSTVYQEVKTRVWAMLQAEGLVPAGSVS